MKKFKLLFALLIILSFFIGCKKDDNPVEPVDTKLDVNGTWNGTTSQGKQISFRVVNNNLDSLTFGYKIQGDFCTTEGTIWVTFSNPKAISGKTFTDAMTGSGPSSTSYTIEGTFNSSTSASGKLDVSFKQSSPNPSCKGSANLTWNAMKQ
jgi:hypothetical protein